MGFFLDDELGVTGNTRTKFGRQCNRFVQRVGVQRLGTTEHCSHRLNRGTHHVVVRILLGQAPAAGLAVGAQHQRLRIFRIELFHDAAPQQARRTHLGNFQVEVHANSPEEGQTASEGIYVHALRQGGLHILFTVGQSEGQLQRLVGTRLLHVVATDRDGVELGHVLAGVLDDVTNDAHAGLWWVNIGITHHELFQNVVLNGTAELVLAHALLFRRHHIACQHGQHCAVHRHRHTNLVQRNTVEQDFHVFYTVNGHTRLAHVTRYTRVVAVVTTVGGQVKSYRYPLTTCGQGFAVKRIGFFSGRETCILANRPRAYRIHSSLRAAQERLKTRQCIRVRQVGGIRCRVQWLHANTIGSNPIQCVNVTIWRRLGGRFVPRFQIGD